MKNPDAILTADWHLRADTPQCRNDDFVVAMQNKVNFIFELAGKYDIPVLIAGDIGHRPQWPNWLIEWFMSICPDIEVIAIPGQHDLPAHNLELQRKSGFGVLRRAGYIEYDDPVIKIYKQNKKFFYIDCAAYGEKIKSSKRGEVLIVHQMVIEDKPLWPGQEAPKGHQLLKKFPGYKLILSGDNHKPFVAEYEGRILVNPGSLMRTTADQINHKPRVYLWRFSDNVIEAVYLPIKGGVISREYIDKAKEKDARIEAYTARLSEHYEIGLSFEGNMEEHLKANRIRKPVKERIWEACS